MLKRRLRKTKITTLGVILALKNLGVYLAAHTVSGIKQDPYQFAFSLGIYALMSIPSDLYLMNHATDKAAKKAVAEAKP